MELRVVQEGVPELDGLGLLVGALGEGEGAGPPPALSAGERAACPDHAGGGAGAGRAAGAGLPHGPEAAGCGGAGCGGAGCGGAGCGGAGCGDAGCGGARAPWLACLGGRLACAPEIDDVFVKIEPDFFEKSGSFLR